MGIATIGLELKVENERSTVVGFFCLHSVDLQNTLENELKCMPHLQHDYLTYLPIVSLYFSIPVLVINFA